MIVIKVEMWPGGDRDAAFEMERVYIYNDGLGTNEVGNYEGIVMKSNELSTHWSKTYAQYRTGTVKGYPRLAKINPLRLVLRMLKNLFPEEQA